MQPCTGRAMYIFFSLTLPAVDTREYVSASRDSKSCDAPASSVSRRSGTAVTQQRSAAAHKDIPRPIDESAVPAFGSGLAGRAEGTKEVARRAKDKRF